SLGTSAASTWARNACRSASRLSRRPDSTPVDVAARSSGAAASRSTRSPSFVRWTTFWLLVAGFPFFAGLLGLGTWTDSFCTHPFRSAWGGGFLPSLRGGAPPGARPPPHLSPPRRRQPHPLAPSHKTPLDRAPSPAPPPRHSPTRQNVTPP